MLRALLPLLHGSIIRRFVQLAHVQGAVTIPDGPAVHPTSLNKACACRNRWCRDAGWEFRHRASQRPAANPV